MALFFDCDPLLTFIEEKCKKKRRKERPFLLHLLSMFNIKTKVGGGENRLSLNQ